MNERIKELSRIAKDWASDSMMEYNSDDTVEPIDFIFFYTKEFAELIVAECMKVVINGKYSATECERNTHRIAHNNARDESSSDIKKHFGVE